MRAPILPVTLALAICIGACSSPPPPPPAGLVSEELAALPDPAVAIRERVAAMEPLLQDSSGDAEESQATLERLAREISELCGRSFLDDRPLLRSELRTLVLFLPVRRDPEQASNYARVAALAATLPPS